MKKVIPNNAVLVPNKAKKVFAGHIFDVYQWPQQMFDGNVKTFEMLKRPDTVQIIAIKDGKIVVVHDEQPGREGARMHFPGGRVDEEDASWLEAAQREMLEETGMTFSNWRLVHLEQPQQKIEWFVPFFVATGFMSQTEQSLDSDGEKIEVELRELLDLRKAVLSGEEPTLNYAIPLLQKVQSIDDLLELAEYSGQVVER